MTTNNGFKGKSIVVTGAGSGIGRAAALQFALQGGKVLLADLNETTAKVVSEEIHAAGGIAITVIGDLSDQVVVDKIVATAIDVHGGIDILVNNASIMDSMSAHDEVTTKEWDRVIRVNAVVPGGTRTNIQVVPIEGTEGPKILGGYMSNVGRIAEADEVAAAIVFLASDAASDINGVVLPVDGGWSAV